MEKSFQKDEQNALAERLQSSLEVMRANDWKPDALLTVQEIAPELGMARLLELSSYSALWEEQAIRPRPDFAERLEQMLLAQARLKHLSAQPPLVLPERPATRVRLRWHFQLTAAVAAALALALLIPLIFAILDQPYTETGYEEYATGTAKNLPLLPRLSAPVASAAGEGEEGLPSPGGGLFGQVNFKAEQARALLSSPAAVAPPPAEMPLYRQAVQPWSPDEARIVAYNLGFDPATLKEDPLTTDAYLFSGQDGSLLALSRKVKGLWSYNARPDGRPLFPGRQSDLAEAPATTEQISYTRAQEIARNFIEKAQIFGATSSMTLLPYRLPGSQPPSASLQVVEFIQTVKGTPVYGPKARVLIDGKGQVLLAASELLPLEKGQNYPIISSEEALQKLAEHKLPLFQSDFHQDRVAGTGNQPVAVAGQSVTLHGPAVTPPPNLPPPGPRYKVGDTVEISGRFVAAIVRNSGHNPSERYYASLLAYQGSTTYNFTLVGTKAREIAELDGFRLKVKGKITGIMAVPPDPMGLQENQGYRLELESAQKEPPGQERLNFLGRISLENIDGVDYKKLVDDNGSEYLAPLGSAITPELYRQMLQQAREEVTSQPPDWQTAAEIQTTGETVNGLPVVELHNYSSHPGIQRGEQDSANSAHPAVIQVQPPIVPDGTNVLIKSASLAYYATPLESLAGVLSASGEERAAQPVYQFSAEWTTDEERVKGEALLLAPAARPEFLAK